MGDIEGMISQDQFIAFPKMSRLSRDMIITEKIDGTNAQIIIEPVGNRGITDISQRGIAANRDLGLVMLAGSRTRFITPLADNFGFAAWAQAHADELWALGVGHHYGEWWGSGIQRGYGLPPGEKRFSLFNTYRWSDALGARPACCHVVPVLKRWTFDTAVVDEVLELLKVNGSAAAPGFMHAEGVVVYHTASNSMFKKTCEKDVAKGGTVNG